MGFRKEEGFSGTGEENRRGATRGAHGGIAPSRAADTRPPSEQVDEGNPPQSYRGRGRGRGGRGGRGGNRGDYSGPNHNESNKKRGEHQQPPSAADFPELPSSAAPAASKEAEAPRTSNSPLKVRQQQQKPKQQMNRNDLVSRNKNPLACPRPWKRGVVGQTRWHSVRHPKKKTNEILKKPFGKKSAALLLLEK